MAENRKNISPEAMEEEENTSQNYSQNVNKFDEKNYLNIKLAKGENSKELKIRLLPVDKDSTSPFQEVHMHSVKVSKEISPNSEWKTYMCIKKTKDIDHERFGDKCPFCELNHEAYVKYEDAMKEAEKIIDPVAKKAKETEAERWKTVSKSARSNEGCIIRCIERGHEDEGPKFWKFSLRSDELDPKHLIKSLYATRKQESIEEAMEEYGVDRKEDLPENFIPENILDVETGKDLKVTISRVFDKNKNPTDKTSISITDYGKNKPLSPDPEQMDVWINDEKRWNDVFSVKPYEYLSLIIDGEVPFYDRLTGKWVSKIAKKETDKKEQEKAEETAEEKIKAAEAKMKAMAEEAQPIEDSPEDLPF